MLQTLQDGQNRIINLIEKIPENNLPKGTIANKYIPEGLNNSLSSNKKCPVTLASIA